MPCQEAEFDQLSLAEVLRELRPRLVRHRTVQDEFVGGLDQCALTLGEPAGIGPDIAIAAWLKRRELDLPAFYLIGDSAFIKARANLLNANLAVADVKPEDAAAARVRALAAVLSGAQPLAA